MRKLIVAEKFYSLQCEGRSIGVPAVFLRLAGCNLLCKGKGWICDTIEVWQKGEAKFFDQVLEGELVERLRNGAHLVITGGEPLMQQEALVDYLYWFEEFYGFLPYLEIETNGTVVPYAYLLQRVPEWNVSPKLSNSGEPAEKRIVSHVIAIFNALPETIFKFVVQHEGDVQEILQDYDLDMKKVVLMPAGATREELDAVRLQVVEQAKLLGVRYSDRLHIVIWNQKTGV